MVSNTAQHELDARDVRSAAGRGGRSSGGAARGAGDGPAARDAAAGTQPAPPGFSIGTHRELLLAALVTLVLKSLIFEPIALWPLSFVCLVPWLVMAAAGAKARAVYAYSYLMGLAFFVINMRWLYHATGLGYIALAVYMAAYFPLMACALRHAVRRRGWPLGVVFPIVWVGSEMLRAVILSGFPWFFLSHSNYRVLTLTQVSDLVGAYGLSFVVAAVNGALADVALMYLARRRGGGAGRGRVIAGGAFAAVLLLATIVYGRYRLGQDTLRDGPTVAILQGDFISSVDPTGDTEEDKFAAYLSMLHSAGEHDPDLYLLPESPWYMSLNPEARMRTRLSAESYLALQKFATDSGGTIVTGAAALEFHPGDPIADRRQFNSAAVVYADGREPGRYDKRHLVPFGEAVPFRVGRLRFLYFWLNRLLPFSEGGKYEYSLFPGDGYHGFEMQAPSRGGETFRFGTPICYEDVMPYVSRKFVSDGGEKKVDFLLNISNDGWFGRGIQQPQHLAICTFRAVENRVGIARAVNTGGSAFIEPTGRIDRLVGPDTRKRWPGDRSGVGVGTLKVDSRYSLYSRYGDWFAWGCAGLWMVMYVDYFGARVRARRSGA